MCLCKVIEWILSIKKSKKNNTLLPTNDDSLNEIMDNEPENLVTIDLWD